MICPIDKATADAFRGVNPLIGKNVNAQWGHLHAKESRSCFSTPFDAAVHRGYVAFFQRRGVRPPPVECAMIESLRDLHKWAAHT